MLIRFALYNDFEDIPLTASDYEEIGIIKDYFESEYNTSFDIEIIDVERRAF